VTKPHLRLFEGAWRVLVYGRRWPVPYVTCLTFESALDWAKFYRPTRPRHEIA
jgi:hypothetical protein